MFFVADFALFAGLVVRNRRWPGYGERRRRRDSLRRRCNNRRLGRWRLCSRSGYRVWVVVGRRIVFLSIVKLEGSFRGRWAQGQNRFRVGFPPGLDRLESKFTQRRGRVAARRTHFNVLHARARHGSAPKRTCSAVCRHFRQSPRACCARTLYHHGGRLVVRFRGSSS